MTIDRLTIALLVGSICTLSSNMLWADLVSSEIKNTSDGTTANDLHLVFSGGKLRGGTTVRVRSEAGKDNDGIVVPAGGSGKIDFGVGKLPANVGPGHLAKVRFSDDGVDDALVLIDRSLSFWTDDDANIVGPRGNVLASVGAPPGILFSGGQAFAKFTNPDTVALIYSSISLYRNNDLSGFNIDGFDTPMGELVTSIPTVINVNPGETVLVSFGNVLPNAYELALADVASLSDPSDTYSVADASAVPEPSTWALIVVGCLAIIVMKRNVEGGIIRDHRCGRRGDHLERDYLGSIARLGRL